MAGAKKAETKVRKRLNPDDSRQLAIHHAREILLHEGASSVTLKSVAQRMGCTHANVLHHFGSAQNLQTALARNICERIGDMVEQTLKDFWEKNLDVDATADTITHLAFQAFDQEGGAQVCVWVLTHNEDNAIDLLLAPLAEVAEKLMPFGDPEHLQKTVLKLVLMAMSHALIGQRLSIKFGLPADEPLQQAKQMLADRLRIIKSQRAAA